MPPEMAGDKARGQRGVFTPSLPHHGVVPALAAPENSKQKMPGLDG